MKRKVIVFIGVIVIPIFLLLIDHLYLKDELDINASYDDSQAWQYIFQHQDEYPMSLIKLALSNKETISFVYQYPQKHLQNVDMTLQEELQENGVPLLLQWDERWGYKTYGNDLMAVNGCGPTCLSMVSSYLKQNSQYHPYFIAQYAYRRGYHSEQGTSWDLMTEGAQDLGLNVQELSLDENQMIQQLQMDHPIICSMRAGVFTTTGHYIVVRDYQDGLFYVNDPNSRLKSQQGYTFTEIKNQIKNIWAYSL